MSGADDCVMLARISVVCVCVCVFVCIYICINVVFVCVLCVCVCVCVFTDRQPNGSMNFKKNLHT